MIKKLVVAMLVLCGMSFGQYIPVTTAPSGCIVDASGAALASGKLIVNATDLNNNPIPFRISTGTGAATISTVSRIITAGSLASSLQLGNPALSAPVNVRYHFAIKDDATNKITNYPQVFLAANDSGNFNLCKYDPSSGLGFPPVTAPTPLSVLLTPAGDQTITSGSLIVSAGNIQTGLQLIASGQGVGTGLAATYLRLGNTLYGSNPYICFNCFLTTSSIGTSTNGFSPIFSDGSSRTMGMFEAAAADGRLTYYTATYTTAAEVNFSSFISRFSIDPTNGNVSAGGLVLTTSQGITSNTNIPIKPPSGAFVDIVPAASGNGLRIFNTSYSVASVSLTDLGISMAPGSPIGWNGDTGLSRLGVGFLGLGNGTAGSVAGSFETSTIQADTQFNVGSASGVVRFWSGAAYDAGISRIAANTIGFGAGTAGDRNGSIQAGTFNAMVATSQIGVSMGGDNNGALEVGPPNSGGVARTPFIDFHWHATGTATDGQDFNARLVNSADNEFTFAFAGGTSFVLNGLAGAMRFGTGTVQFGSAVGSVDLGLSRSASGTLAIGNGTAANSSGLAIAGGFLQTTGISRIDSRGIVGSNASLFGFTSTTDSGGTIDVAFSRLAADSLALGNGTAGNKTGALEAGFLIADSQLSLGTSTTVLNFWSGSAFDASISRLGSASIQIGNGGNNATGALTTTTLSSLGALNVASNSTQWSNTGLLTSYKSTATAGNGQPIIVATVNSASLATNVTTTTLFTPTVTNFYRLCYTGYTQSTGTGTTASLTFTWATLAGTKSFTTPTFSLAASDITSQVNGCQIMRALNGNNVTYALTAGSFGTSTINLQIMLEQL